MKNALRSVARHAYTLGSQLLDDSVAALFPCSCLHCDAPLEEDRFDARRATRRWAGLWNGQIRRTLIPGVRLPLRLLCPSCSSGLALARPAVSTLVPLGISSLAAFVPSPVLFRLIHAFKYEACQELGAFLGGHLARTALREGCHESPGILLPIPLHAVRLQSRRFNQAQILAEVVGRVLRMPVMTDVLRRCRNTPALAKIDEAERWQHVSGAFELWRRPPPATRIWLVDDVVTSGATVCAAREALPSQAHLAGVLSLCRAS